MRVIVGTGLVATAALSIAAPAEARIVCRDGFQVVNGTEIATPFCQDNRLAGVAREYGFKASDAEIRNNPNTKRYVCRFVGHDIRVRENCPNENGSRRAR